MKIKTAELKGAALDWVVAECEGYSDLRRNTHQFDSAWIMTSPRAAYGPVFLDDYSFSTEWAQGGPIIEHEKITTVYDHDALDWVAEKLGPTEYELSAAFGSTPLIAAMRCYVASKLGDEVEIPEELA